LWFFLGCRTGIVNISRWRELLGRILELLGEFFILHKNVSAPHNNIAHFIRQPSILAVVSKES
jgi:hypothetical protein